MTAEYEPRHRAEIETLRIPPSLGYKEWRQNNDADEEQSQLLTRDLGLFIVEMDEWTKLCAGVTMNLWDFFTALAEVPMSETRAGHEWDSRSWFA